MGGLLLFNSSSCSNLNSAGKKIYMLEDVVSDANVEESAKNAFDKVTFAPSNIVKSFRPSR